TSCVKFSGIYPMKAASRTRAPTTVKRTVRRGRPLTGSELRALRRLRREQEPSRYLFLSERGAPMSAVGFRRMITRLGKAAKMPFSVHPHMLRHASGLNTANDGHDTRALQHYLGHKNIQHTVRTREYLTEKEVERLMKAAGRNRYGHRDATMILLAFRHGLRASIPSATPSFRPPAS